MGTSVFLMQGLAKHHGHHAAVQSVLKTKNLSYAAISVAFATARGVALIASDLKRIKDRVEVFVGIRNGVTTLQSLKSLLDLGIKPLCVDTGSSSVIFHPKVYFAQGTRVARLLVGSSNLTVAGLSTNLEAGYLVELDCSDRDDKRFVKSINDSFSVLRSISKDHVYKVNTLDIALGLFHDGLLIDERHVRPAATGVASRHNGVGRIGNIPGKWTPIPVPTIDLNVTGIQFKVRPTKRSKASSTDVKKRRITSTLGYEPEWELMWESKGLSERDLRIPKGKNTNPTGSMLLKAGLWKGIDFQRHFRHEVFDRLDWVKDGASKHLHLAVARFVIRIGGVHRDMVNLEIRHNSDETSATFKQKNAMTSLRWGPAKSIIAQDDLKGRTLRLFRAPAEKDLFLIEID